jgi:hypothetical protein
LRHWPAAMLAAWISTGSFDRRHPHPRCGIIVRLYGK